MTCLQAIEAICVDEDTYKPDLVLLSQFQVYSAELLRISLLGLSVFGVLLSNKLLSQAKVIFVVSIIFFGFSSAFALFHRFYSTTGLRYHIKYLRSLKTHAIDTETLSKNRNRAYKYSAVGLGLATLFAGGATCLLCAGFVSSVF